MRCPRLLTVFLVVVGGGLLLVAGGELLIQRQSRQSLQETVTEFKAGTSHSVFLRSYEHLDALADDPQCAAKVEEVEITDRDLSDPRWARIKAFSNLRKLSVEYCQSDAFFNRIERIPRLESVEVNRCVTTATLQFLAKCPH